MQIKPRNIFHKESEHCVEMGCTNSHFVQNSMTVHPFVAIEKTIIPLTAEQIRMVRETWEIIEPHKKQLGVDIFTR